MTEDKSPTTALAVDIPWGSGCGPDLGHVGLGLGKLLTAGGFGVWWLIDIFLIQAAARKA